MFHRSIRREPYVVDAHTQLIPKFKVLNKLHFTGPLATFSALGYERRIISAKFPLANVNQSHRFQQRHVEDPRGHSESLVCFFFYREPSWKVGENSVAFRFCTSGHKSRGKDVPTYEKTDWQKFETNRWRARTRIEVLIWIALVLLSEENGAFVENRSR